jgi:colanic acid biosynthesis glycosyl transferase WcaI
MPSVLFLNRVYPPDRGATGMCLADLARGLVERGWTVTVVAEGDGPTGDGGGVRVVRTGRRRATRRTILGSLAALARLERAARFLPRHDLVVSLSDPPLLALAGERVARRMGAAAVHWCHDLYPPLLAVVAPWIPAPVVRAASALAGCCLRRHDAVIAIGRCMAMRLGAIGLDPARVTVLPNWPDPAIRPADGAAFRAAHGLEGRFVALYAGNLGGAHPWRALVDAARLLEDDAVILVAGDGRQRARFEMEATDLANLRFLPWLPADTLPDLLAAADLHLATMDERAAGLMVPRKVAAAFAAERPCLFLGPRTSEAARCIEEYGAGLVLPPHEGGALAEAIRVYRDDPARRKREGRHTHRAAADWSADLAITHFAALAERLVRESAR